MKKALLILGVIASIPMFLFVTSLVANVFFFEIFNCYVSGFDDPSIGCNSALYYFVFAIGLIALEIYAGFVVVFLIRKLKGSAQTTASGVVVDAPDLNVETVKPLSRFKFLYFVFSGLPLIGYPLVFLASVMSLGGGLANDELLLWHLVPLAFLWGSILYPVVYIFCVIAFFVTDSERKKNLFVKIPYWYLILCGALLCAWMFLGYLFEY